MGTGWIGSSQHVLFVSKGAILGYFVYLQPQHEIFQEILTCKTN